MTGTIPRTRPKVRPNKILAPSIREVCLVGSPGRRYVHVTPKGLRSKQDIHKSM